MLHPEDNKTGYTTESVIRCPVCGGELRDEFFEHAGDESRLVRTCRRCGTEVSLVYAFSCTHIRDSRFVRTMTDEQLQAKLLRLARMTGQPGEIANLDDCCAAAEWLEGVMETRPELKSTAERLLDEIARLD